MSTSNPNPPSRRWDRLRFFRHLRRRNHSHAPAPAPAPSPPPPPPPEPDNLPASAAPLRSVRRHRARRASSSDPRLYSDDDPVINGALRYRRPDFDTIADARLGSPAAITAALADLEGHPDRSLVAMVNRLFDEYTAENPESTAHLLPPDLHTTALYQGRLPPHGRHRVAMRFHNAYYIAGARRQARHSHLTTELEREFRWSFRTVRFTPDGGSSSYDFAASDDQIEALPTFIMEKGEERSIPQIFASMGAGRALDDSDVEDEPTNEDDGEDAASDSNPDTECAICLSEFEPGDEITMLPCGHYFHFTGCVREWLGNHARTCPTCRADICTNTASSDGLASQSATIATSEDIS